MVLEDEAFNWAVLGFLEVEKVVFFSCLGLLSASFPSVRPSARPSVRLSVCPSIHLLFRSLGKVAHQQDSLQDTRGS